MSICQWGFIPGRVQMDVGCILEMVSSYLRNPTMRLAKDHLPEKDSGAKPLEELTLAKDQGEKQWHEEEWQYRILPLLEWLAV